MVQTMQAPQAMDMYDNQSAYMNQGQVGGFINHGQTPAGYISQGQPTQQRPWNSSYDDQYEEEFDPRMDYGKITHL